MTSNVYFTSLESTKKGDNRIQKLQELYEKTKFDYALTENDNVAIKTHFGEIDNTTFLNPLYSRQLVDNLKKNNCKPFLTDTSSITPHSRNNTLDHLETAVKHGFTYSVINAPVIIADGISGNNETEIEINENIFKTVKIARDIHDSDAMIVLTHITAHPLLGLNGAIASLSSCASKNGKIELHKIAPPNILKIRCVACNQCVKGCPENAITLNPKAEINYNTCIGCNECVEICPTHTIKTNLTNMDEYLESVVEYAYATSINKKDNKILYINFLTNITPHSDSKGFSNKPIVEDIGILASYDPVAIDKASYDLINNNGTTLNSKLEENTDIELDKFKEVWFRTDAKKQINLAEDINMGSSKYKLIKI